MARETVKCQTCGEAFTPKQFRGHANMWGHYEAKTQTGAIVNHSRYPQKQDERGAEYH